MASVKENDTSAGGAISTFSAGLVQISGLSTMLGGRSVDELSLGLKGASGLAWAPVSTFGLLKAIKIWIAGVAPSSFRDVLGLRSAVVDDAIGFGLWRDTNKPPGYKQTIDRSTVLGGQQDGSKVGLHLDCPFGCEAAEKRMKDDTDPKKYCDENPVLGWHSDFALERALQATTTMTTLTGEDGEIYIHSFIPDDTVPEFHVLDWAVILASGVKLLEAVTLYKLGSRILWWSSFVGWAICFLAAIYLQAFNLGRDVPSNTCRVHDYLIADLPSYNRPGGSSKQIIIGQPASVREHPGWKCSWAIAALASGVSLATTFYALAKGMESVEKVVYTWVAFQVGWSLLRTSVYYAIPDSVASTTVNLSAERWHKSTSLARLRTLRLLIAASQQQTHGHMRVFPAYAEDLLSLKSPSSLTAVLQKVNWTMSLLLTAAVAQNIHKVKIEAILGEELLRTIAWATGSRVSIADLYDVVAVLFNYKGINALVPGARVMAGKPTRPTEPDEEKSAVSFDARGTYNKDKTGFWVYWFPIESCNAHRPDWLQLSCNPFSVLGAIEGHCVLSYEELDRKLGAGKLSISLKGVADLEKIIDASKLSTEALLKMMKPAYSSRGSRQSTEEAKEMSRDTAT